MEHSTEAYTKRLNVWCKVCKEYFEITDPKRIFSGGKFSEYATRCPVCNTGRSIPFKDVENVFGNLSSKFC